MHLAWFSVCSSKGAKVRAAGSHHLGEDYWSQSLGICCTAILPNDPLLFHSFCDVHETNIGSWLQWKPEIFVAHTAIYISSNVYRRMLSIYTVCHIFVKAETTWEIKSSTISSTITLTVNGINYKVGLYLQSSNRSQYWLQSIHPYLRISPTDYNATSE